MARTKAQHVQAKRKARTARRQRQTRDEILDAACQIVLRDGSSGFTLAAVAEELGLTNPALYYYFDSKEALSFALILREWLACGAEVRDAVEATDNGADAVEALIRTLFERYRERLDMFLLVHQKMVELGAASITKEQLDRLRPVNGMLYSGAESRLRADQDRGVFPRSRDPRRFAFTAHMAVIGLLNMKAMTAAANDPLIHTDEDLVNDLCSTFRHAATAGDSK